MTDDIVHSSPPVQDPPFSIGVTYYELLKEDDDGVQHFSDEKTLTLWFRPNVPAAATMGLEAMSGTSRNNVGGGAMYDFFDLALTPTSRREQQDLINNPKKYVTSAALGEVAGRAWARYGARPTGTPAG